MLPAILGGLALAGGKSIFDQMRADRQRRLSAEQTRMSPWTRQQPIQVQEPDIFGTLLQGGLTGALMGNLGAKPDALASGAAGAGTASGSNIYKHMLGNLGLKGMTSRMPGVDPEDELLY
jgi:hypothetical protein